MSKKTQRILWILLLLLVTPFVIYLLVGIYGWVFFGRETDLDKAGVSLIIASFGSFALGAWADLQDLWRGYDTNRVGRI